MTLMLNPINLFPMSLKVEKIPYQQMSLIFMKRMQNERKLTVNSQVLQQLPVEPKVTRLNVQTFFVQQSVGSDAAVEMI